MAGERKRLTKAQRAGWIPQSTAEINEMFPVVREDMLDFPTAWAIQRDRGTTLAHHPRCSSVPGWAPISGPGFLCDCGAVEKEWARMIAAQAAGRRALAEDGGGND